MLVDAGIAVHCAVVTFTGVRRDILNVGAKGGAVLTAMGIGALGGALVIASFAIAAARTVHARRPRPYGVGVVGFASRLGLAGR